MEKITLKKSNLILCPSNFLINELKKNYDLKGYYLPPLMEKLRRKRHKSKKKIILTFGSISPGKGSLEIEKSIDAILRTAYVKNLTKSIELGETQYESNRFFYQENYNESYSNQAYYILEHIGYDIFEIKE